jgi:predicted dehydrogenase
VIIPEGFTMAKKPLTLGVLGCADIAVSRVIPNLRTSRKVEVRAIASRDMTRAREWAVKYGIEQYFGSYEQLLEGGDVEAVYIPLVNSLHSEWTNRALQSGRHVICEKPLALTPEQVRDMIRTAKAKNLVLMEAFMYRYHPRNTSVFDMVRTGEIGTLKAVESAFTYVLDDASSYLFSRELGGGALFDVGCYPVNVSRMITGSEPVEVYGTANYASTRVDMTFSGIMRFPGGVLSSFHAAMDEEPRFWYRVIGDKGLIEVPWAFVSFGKKTEIWIQKSEKSRTVSFEGVDEYRLEFEHFADVVRGKSQPNYSIEDSLRNSYVIEALLKSAETGVPVRV